MVYERYIYRNGKKFGPYYYHTYRDKDGKTHSRYVEHHELQHAKPFGKVSKPFFSHTQSLNFGKHKTLFVLLAAIFAIIFTVIFLNYQFSGKEVKHETSDSLISSIGKGIYSFVTGLTSETPEEPSAGGVTSDGSLASDSGSVNSAPDESSDVGSSETFASGESTQEVQPETIPEIATDDGSSDAVNETTEEINETDVNIDNETTQNEIIGNITNQPALGEDSMVVKVNVTNQTISNETSINESTANITESNLTVVENMTNVTVVNETINITTQVSIKQYSAVLGKPVKWEKKVVIGIEGANSTENLVIDLPKEAGNVSVKKIRDGVEEEVDVFVSDINEIKEVEPTQKEAVEQEGNIFTGTFSFFLNFFRSMTARVVDIQKESDSVKVDVQETLEDKDELVVEYYTDAPYSVEEESGRGKKVFVVSPSEVDYENVLIFTELNESLNIKSSGSVTVYWEENKTYIPIESIQDLNQNGIYDYIEWVAPHLSNQTFTIIVIVKAEHLDSNKNFISNIYESVKELDGNWSEAIPSQHYVRVTFEKNLTYENDITIYPRIVNGTPRIEVYEKNKTEIIAEFGSVTENEYNKVYLTGLNESQDTFDLRILDGELEFDHIIDPTAGPNSSTFDTTIRPTSCGGEDRNAGNDFSDACDGTYPNSTCGNGGDLVSCNDAFNETMLFSQIGGQEFAGIKVNISNSSITNCGRIDKVFACFEWWITSGSGTSCRVTVSNGTTESDVNTTCPTTTANPGVYCQDVTSNLTWTCGNFFQITSESYIESEVRHNSGFSKTANWDVLYYNISYTNNPPNVTLLSPANAASLYGSTNLSFSCNVTDDKDIVNVTLYGNWSGGWHANQTASLTGAPNVSVNVSFNVSVLPTGNYLWNCLAYDNDSLADWADSNRTFTFDQCSLTQVSSSTTLTSDNCEYYNVTANNLVFDCANYKIYGENTDTFWGIQATNRDNLTIKNCRMEQYAKVVLFNSTNNSLITNSTLYNNSHINVTSVLTYGIYFDKAHNNTVNTTNITKLWSNSTSNATCYSGSLYAFYITGSNNTLFNNSIVNDINGQYYGIQDEVCSAGYTTIGEGIYTPASGYSDNIDVLNSNLSSIYNTVIYLDNNSDVLINNSRISYAMTLVRIGPASKIVNISNSQLNYSTSTAVSVLSGMSGKLLINNNQIHHHSSATAVGISIISDVTNGADIIGNTFSNISSNYIETRSDNSNISNNFFRDTPSGFASSGILIEPQAASAFLSNNTFFNFGNSLNSYAVRIRAVANASYFNITNCGVGFLIDTSIVNSSVWNSTITNCTKDFSINTGADNFELYNVTFNKSRADFQSDGSGFMEVFYQYRTNVTNQNLAAVNLADVSIKNVSGTQISDAQLTDANGLTNYEWVMEYIQKGDANYTSGCTGSTFYINCSTPHNVTASKTGYSTNSTNITIDQSKTAWIMIESPFILAYVPTTINFSIVENNNQTFSITYTNASAVTIRWFVNDTEQTGSTNSSQYIWVGNFSQQGFYRIKVNLTDSNGAFDEQIWWMTVNNTYPTVDLNLTYPVGNLNATQNQFFNVTLNVTCRTADCGTINLSLFSNNSLVNTTTGAMPYYTNMSNPYTTVNLNFSNSQIVNFWVNATGNINYNSTFVANANLTDNTSISNATSAFNVTIVSPSFSVSISLSSRLSQQINWTLTSLPAYNQSAQGNNGTGLTEYYVDIQVEGGTADIYVKANDNLTTPGGDILGIGNETYSYNYTNLSVPSDIKTSLTTNYSDNKIGNAMNNGSVIYLKFFLNAPAGQAAGTYNNSLLFKAVQTGQSP